MVESVNTTWDSQPHDLFSSQYAASLVVRDYADQRLTDGELGRVTSWMTRSPETGILRASVEVDPDIALTICRVIVEAPDELRAMRNLTKTFIGGLAQSSEDMDVECLEFGGFNVAQAAQLDADRLEALQEGDEPHDITHKRYAAEELADVGALDAVILPDGDDYEEAELFVLPHVDVAEEYYKARNAQIWGDAEAA